MKQNARKRLKPSRQSRQMRKHKPRSNHGWVLLRPTLPMSLWTYRTETVRCALQMKFRKGGSMTIAVRRRYTGPGYLDDVIDAVRVKSLRFRREKPTI